ncbi:MAG: DotU family type VI secretion system protein [Burkholderiales bacterium]|nr:DotU family type VI secretion system protein [Burkholderiales bacterium]
MAADPPRVDDPFESLEPPQRPFPKPGPAQWRSAGDDGTTTTTLQGAAAPEPELGLNPLLALANRLLLLVPQLRRTRQADPVSVRAALAQGIRDFQAAAQTRGIAPERAMAARYVLCTMLDEAAAETPWGGSGAWARNTLLAEFHNEVSGGEKVFQLMARLADKPAANRDLLELIYAAISLGFEGRYRVAAQGREQLDAIRAKLAQLIQRERGSYAPALAAHWQGQPARARPGLSWLPLALTAALTLLVLAGIYAAFAYSLAGRADPVYARIQGLRLAPPVAAVAQPAPQPRLALFLEPDIRAGLVAVRDEVDRSVVTLHGDTLFASGSATPSAEREALLQRIAQALVRVGGDVLVSGYTDNQPMRSLRFPSNWHLSDERARAVRAILVAAGVPDARIRAEGRADSDPVASNDTPANRALNRRVEITLRPARTDTPARAASAGG